MAHTECFSLKPHRDVELGISKRESFDCFVTFPTSFSRADPHGLVLVLHGFGDSPRSPYQTEELRPLIADRYNVLVIGVDYHKNESMSTAREIFINIDGICDFYEIEKSHFASCKSFDDVTNAIYKILDIKKIASLDPRLSIKTSSFYDSFGFIPALDCILSIGFVLNRYKINRDFISILGTSYGSYIGLLINKFAPRTFSMIIDNSGFTGAKLNFILSGNFAGAGSPANVKVLNGKRREIPFENSSIWQRDDSSSCYFSDDKKMIRDLLVKEHYFKSNTFLSMYHSQCDEIEDISSKDSYFNLIKAFRECAYKRVEENDLNGGIFKTLDHGMHASLYGIFNDSYENFASRIYRKKTENIDFDLGSEYVFDCHKTKYKFNYTNDSVNCELINVFPSKIVWVGGNSNE